MFDGILYTAQTNMDLTKNTCKMNVIHWAYGKFEVSFQ